MSATAPPYESLLDRARNFGRALREAGHSTGISYGEIADTVTALALIAEHGEGLLDDFDKGGYDAIEPVLTPDRPEGWAPVQKPMDARDQEILRLRAELDGLRVDPRDAELEELRKQIADARVPANPTMDNITRPESSDTDARYRPPGYRTPDEIQAESERVRNAGTARAEQHGTHVEVSGELDPAEQAKLDALKPQTGTEIKSADDKEAGK